MTRTPNLPADKCMCHSPKLDWISELIDEPGTRTVLKQLKDGLGLEIEVVELDDDLLQFRADPDVVLSRSLIEVRRARHVVDVGVDVFHGVGVLELPGRAHPFQRLRFKPQVDPGVAVHVEDVTLVMPIP
jgi:hypothetical protein